MREGTVQSGSPRVSSNRRRFLQAAIGIGVASVAGARSVRGQEPTEIEDWHDLDAVREDFDGDYVLVSDLDETTPGYDEHVGDPKKGWNPLGGRDFVVFTGTFDGNGHEITGLQIDRPDEDSVGLFKMVLGGQITDVTLTELDITGEDEVGGLVGINRGEVSESTASGGVTGEDEVGGLVGINRGEVSESTASGGVTGEDEVGGLVGANGVAVVMENGCVVSQSSASGDVTGNSRVGGLVGANGGVVSESTASGGVTGDSRVGGLVGSNGVALVGEDGGVVNESWASGDITGEDEVGGLIGINRGEVSESSASGDVTGEDEVGAVVGINTEEGEVRVSNCEEVLSRQSEEIGEDKEDEDGGVTGLSTEEMQGESARDTMLGPDITTNDGMPGFGIIVAITALGGAGYALKRRLERASDQL